MKFTLVIWLSIFWQISFSQDIIFENVLSQLEKGNRKIDTSLCLRYFNSALKDAERNNLRLPIGEFIIRDSLDIESFDSQTFWLLLDSFNSIITDKNIHYAEDSLSFICETPFESKCYSLYSYQLIINLYGKDFIKNIVKSSESLDSIGLGYVAPRIKKFDKHVKKHTKLNLASPNDLMCNSIRVSAMILPDKTIKDVTCYFAGRAYSRALNTDDLYFQEVQRLIGVLDKKKIVSAKFKNEAIEGEFRTVIMFK